METRIHQRKDGRFILQKKAVEVESNRQWHQCAGPFTTAKTARQGQIRYHKRHNEKTGASLGQQLVSKNWGDVKIKS